MTDANPGVKKRKIPSSLSQVLKHRVPVCLLLFLLISIGVNYGFHRWDNKYTYNIEQQPVCGIMSLSQEELSGQVYFICDGWEFYKGRLLSPADFDGKDRNGRAPLPDAYVRLGQYAGFELDDREGSPYGSATYRVRILLPERKGRYTLELPEIFSAYRLWINGELAFESGDPNPESYRPEVTQTKVSFEAQGQAELIFAVSDFTHYYSGMVYPPAFGTEQLVNRLLSGRLAVKSIQCFLGLSVFLAYLALYLAQRQNRKKLYMALTCLGYLGYASYYLIHAFLPTGNFFWYRLEDFSLLFMLYFLCLLVCAMWGDARSQGMKTAMTAAGLLMMAACLILPSFFTGEGRLGLMLVYGALVDGYKLLVVGYLLFYSARMMIKQREHSWVILCALLFFGTGLAADRLDAVYEPALFGWGAEYGGFVLILVLAAMMVWESIEAQKRSLRLVLREEENARRMEEVVHDLKSPLAAITTFAELSRMDIGQGREQQAEFLMEIETKAEELAARIQRLTRTGGWDMGGLSFCPVESLAYLREIGDKYSSMLAHKGLDLKVKGESFIISIDREQMGLALENLIMNGMRYTQPGGCIVLEARLRKGRKELVISDTGVGMDADYLNAIFHRGVTGDRTEHTGLGLSIVQRVAEAHRGSVLVESKPGEGSRFILRLE